MKAESVSNVGRSERSAARRKRPQLQMACRAALGTPCVHSSAFSLLEVILALAILAGSLAIIGEYARQGVDNAHIAQDLTQAQLLCESKLAEIAAGISLPESTGGEMLETDDGEQWICSVEVTPMEGLNLLSVAVTVSKDTSGSGQPAACTLTRWVADPNP